MTIGPMEGLGRDRPSLGSGLKGYPRKSRNPACLRDIRAWLRIDLFGSIAETTKPARPGDASHDPRPGTKISDLVVGAGFLHRRSTDQAVPKDRWAETCDTLQLASRNRRESLITFIDHAKNQGADTPRSPNYFTEKWTYSISACPDLRNGRGIGCAWPFKSTVRDLSVYSPDIRPGIRMAQWTLLNRIGHVLGRPASSNPSVFAGIVESGKPPPQVLRLGWIKDRCIDSSWPVLK